MCEFVAKQAEVHKQLALDCVRERDVAIAALQAVQRDIELSARTQTPLVAGAPPAMPSSGPSPALLAAAAANNPAAAGGKGKGKYEVESSSICAYFAKGNICPKLESGLCKHRHFFTGDSLKDSLKECWQFKQGKCWRGADCKMSHDEGDSQAQPPAAKRRQVKASQLFQREERGQLPNNACHSFFMKNSKGCSRSSCKYSHTEDAGAFEAAMRKFRDQQAAQDEERLKAVEAARLEAEKEAEAKRKAEAKAAKRTKVKEERDAEEEEARRRRELDAPPLGYGASKDAEDSSSKLSDDDEEDGSESEESEQTPAAQPPSVAAAAARAKEAYKPPPPVEPKYPQGPTAKAAPTPKVAPSGGESKKRLEATKQATPRRKDVPSSSAAAPFSGPISIRASTSAAGSSWSVAGTRAAERTERKQAHVKDRRAEVIRSQEEQIAALREQLAMAESRRDASEVVDEEPTVEEEEARFVVSSQALVSSTSPPKHRQVLDKPVTTTTMTPKICSSAFSARENNRFRCLESDCSSCECSNSDCNMLVAESPAGDVMSMSKVSNDGKYERVDILVDSGASISALPVECARDYPVAPRQGLEQYRTANGGQIVNEGTKTILAETSSGCRKLRFAHMKVRRPIASVSAMTRAGNSVHFTPSGAWIEYPAGNFDKLHERGGVYVLPSWIPPFTRHP